jgi:hypothetical protein
LAFNVGDIEVGFDAGNIVSAGLPVISGLDPAERSFVAKADRPDRLSAWESCQYEG